MFHSYKQLIDKLFSSVFSGATECLSFKDYLSVIGASLLLILALLGTLALFGGAFAGPFFAYRKTMAGPKKLMAEFDHKMNLESYDKIRHALVIRNILFWSIFIFIYLPIAIPTVLYIISLIGSLFA